MTQGSLTLVRGDDTDVGVTVYQSDGSTPYSLTGSSLVMTVRENLNYFSQILFTKTGAILNASEGLAKISFVSDDTDNLSATPYFYDIKLLTAGKTTTLIAGSLLVEPR